MGNDENFDNNKRIMKKEIRKTDLEKLIGAILKIPPSSEINRDSSPEWDSLKHMEIIFSLESKYSVTFSEEEMVQMNSVDTIKNLLYTRNEKDREVAGL